MIIRRSFAVPPRRVYVASSWRNYGHTGVVATLKAAGIDCYDFKHPAPGNEGFHWSEVGMSSYDRETNSAVPAKEYYEGVQHPIAIDGYNRDYQAMQECDACILVLPCGRSAHLELGWFAGQGKLTGVLLEDPVTPELMYGMVDALFDNVLDMLGWLGVED